MAGRSAGRSVWEQRPSLEIARRCYSTAKKRLALQYRLTHNLHAKLHCILEQGRPVHTVCTLDCLMKTWSETASPSAWRLWSSKIWCRVVWSRGPKLHGVTSQKSTILFVTAVRTSYLIIYGLVSLYSYNSCSCFPGPLKISSPTASVWMSLMPWWFRKLLSFCFINTMLMVCL